MAKSITNINDLKTDTKLIELETNKIYRVFDTFDNKVNIGTELIKTIDINDIKDKFYIIEY